MDQLGDHWGVIVLGTLILYYIYNWMACRHRGFHNVEYDDEDDDTSEWGV